MALAASRPTSSLLHTATRATPFAVQRHALSTTPRHAATPNGPHPPPASFRLPTPDRWYQNKPNVLDEAGNYFLLTEMMRGMYVVLEQFFRPP